MTTIVACLDRMVADSQVTDGDDSVTLQDKIYRVRDLLVATSGDCACGDSYIEFLRARRGKRPKFTVAKDGKEEPEDFKALIISRQGLFRVNFDCRPRKLKQTYDAIGSGADAAMGALAMGATPEQAVEIACQIDKVNSSLPLQVVRLCPPTKMKSTTRS